MAIDFCAHMNSNKFSCIPGNIYLQSHLYNVRSLLMSTKSNEQCKIIIYNVYMVHNILK